MAIITCENCGAELPEGASFCAGCGSPVSVAQLGPVYVPLAVNSHGEPQSAELVEGVSVQQRLTVPQAHVAYAGFWLRAGAFVIDRFIISFIFAIIASFRPGVLMIFPELTGQPAATHNQSTLLALVQSLPHLTPAGYLSLLLMMWIYYASFESSSWQATPGKRVLRLYVTDLAGRPATFWLASQRYFFRLISELIFMVGYIVAGFTAKKQALHDILAGCLVLRRP
jgi:uncharacterized RDD family membrane protein YckC